MGSLERSKKRIQIWKKALFHFSLCFAMGFFTGFAPTSKSSIFTHRVAMKQLINSPDFQPKPVDYREDSGLMETGENTVRERNFNRSLMAETPFELQNNSGREEQPSPAEEEPELIPLPPLIVVTPTRGKSALQDAFLSRLGNTLKLVPPPLLWIVVDCQSNPAETSVILRKIGIMYRLLVCKEIFADPSAQIEHQRNVALNHIEQHRLNGIVHFARPYNIYSLQFFNEIREIEVFGTWPVAMVSANRKRVVMEGPVCSAWQVVGWHPRNGKTERRFPISVSGFAFNSSILWDPERWGRISSVQEASQDSLGFVQQVIFEDETKLKGIPDGCSEIMLWHLHIPKPYLHHAIPLNNTLR